MHPVEVLDKWTRVCQDCDMRWYLFRETLLCVNGYGEIPQILPVAQVCVLSDVLTVLSEHIFPVLQEVLQVQITMDGNRFVVLQDHVPVLEIYVLCAVEDSAFSEEYIRKRNRFHKKTKNASLSEKCSALAQLCAGKTATYYCDGVDPKTALLLPADGLRQGMRMTCGDTDYPVFAGYREYLAEKYGDYEDGLFDPVGCGLTKEEKLQLKQHQQRCKEALAFIQQLGKEYHLRYYLIAGSVLGPVRDGGFIPWDDDIDIGIRIEDIDEFERLVKEMLPQRLPEGFALKQTGPYDPYPRMFSKICFEGRCCIDLWPLVPTYESGAKAMLQWVMSKLVTKLHYNKIGAKVGKYNTLPKILSVFLKDRWVLKLARFNERCLSREEPPFYINLYSIYPRQKELIRRQWLDQVETADFDGIEAPIVGCTDAYLTHLYGDYMSRPLPWKRASRHVARF